MKKSIFLQFFRPDRMKRVSGVLLTGLLAGSLLFPSCKDDDREPAGDPPSSDTSIRGLFAYAEHSERGRDTLDVSFSTHLDTLVLTTRALPEGASAVDLTRVCIEVETAPGATANLSPDRPVDLTDGASALTITATDGTIAVFALRAVITPPYEVLPEYRFAFTELWTKSGTELGLVFPKSCRSMAVAGEYLLILDNTIDYSADGKIKAYRKQTGEFVKDVPVYEGGWSGPRSYSWTLAADEAGHFAMGRLNSGGAGFWLDVYESIDAMPVNPFRLTGDQVPQYAGKRMQLLGDLFSGRSALLLTAAHFYGDVPAPGQYCSWRLTDGTPESALPSVFDAGVNWQSAVVEQASLDDPTLFITYNDESGYPNDAPENWNQVHAARFMQFTPGSGEPVLSIDPLNFKYRILDSKVFTVKKGRYLFTLQQEYSTGTGAMSALLYDLTDKKRFSWVPGVAGYEKFRLYESEGYVSQNDLRYGNVAVQVDGDAAYLYVYYPASDGAEAIVTALKMEVSEWP